MNYLYGFFSFFTLSKFSLGSRLATITILALGLCWRLYAWSIQPGLYLDDEIGHFLIARDAWIHPQFIFSFWGRTACTLFYMPGALFGLDAARLSAILAISLTSLFTVHVGQKLKLPYPWLIALFLETQPWIINWGNGILTQIPAVLLCVSALYFALEKRFALAAVLVGILPLARHELIVLVGFFGLFLLYKRHFLGILLLLVPMGLVNLLSYFVYDVFAFAPFFRPKGTTFYGSGGWMHFIKLVIDEGHVGLPVTAAALLGLPIFLREPSRALLFVWLSLVLIVNTVIYRYGLFSSGGFGIFLLPGIAPLFALLACSGVASLIEKTQTQWLNGFRNLLALLLLCSALGYGFQKTTERGPSGRAKTMQKLASKVQELGLVGEELGAMNVWLYHYVPIPLEHSGNTWFKVLWSRNRLKTVKPGEILIWDPYYSDRWGHTLSTFQNPEVWEEIFLLEHKGTPTGGIFRKLEESSNSEEGN